MPPARITQKKRAARTSKKGAILPSAADEVEKPFTDYTGYGKVATEPPSSNKSVSIPKDPFEFFRPVEKAPTLPEAQRMTKEEYMASFAIQGVRKDIYVPVRKPCTCPLPVCVRKNEKAKREKRERVLREFEVEEKKKAMRGRK